MCCAAVCLAATDNQLFLTHRSVSLPAVEQERDLLQPRPYWKEFRFDLTPLPQGETVTAAEFRIYKTLTIGQRANRTLHISVYEIKRENRHRCSCSSPLLSGGNLAHSVC